METLVCGHVAYPGKSRMCRHLVGRGEDGVPPHVRRLTGRGLDFDLLCAGCDGQPVELVVTCEGCVAVYLDDDHRALTAWRGEAGIAERPEPLDVRVRASPLPRGHGPVVDLAPVAGRAAWLLLAVDGTILHFDGGTGEAAALVTTTVPGEGDHSPWDGHPLRRRLHASTDGRFAAVVNDFGHLGQVLDLRTGQVTIALHGGDYHSNTVPFSLAFAVHAGRTVVVHRTEWNRLEVSDPATGALLTTREITAYRVGRERPPHYLDYFHGALYASPDGRWLADDGWVWHPCGIPVVWELRRWLTDNPWESEDGPTRKTLCWRDYHWTSPMCWVGSDLLALSGIGVDDDALLPGVRVFDAASGAELIAFPGPAGALFAAGRRLYSADPAGLTVWDPFTGERTGAVPGFVPTRHHPGARELVAVEGDTLVRWGYPPS